MVAWFDDAGKVPCGEETKNVLSAFLRRLEAAGVQTEKRPFDDRWLDEVYAVWGLLFGSIVGQDASWIARQIMKRQFSTMCRGAVSNVLTSLKAGLDLRFKSFSRALKQRTDLVEELARRFDVYDFIISPVAAGPAFPHNHTHSPIVQEGRTWAYMDYAAPFTILYNSCGNPALVVPAGQSPSGLPVGVQIAAPHYAEHELIQFGKLIEGLGVTFAKPDGY